VGAKIDPYHTYSFISLFCIRIITVCFKTILRSPVCFSWKIVHLKREISFSILIVSKFMLNFEIDERGMKHNYLSVRGFRNIFHCF